MAAKFFNETWDLLERSDRTAEEDARMVHLAHASRLHWEFVGSVKNRSVGEWQVSRAHAVLRQADAALFHAERCLAIAEAGELAPFQMAYAHEAMARALLITKSPMAAAHLEQARKFAALVADPEDKKLIDDDLAKLTGAL